MVIMYSWDIDQIVIQQVSKYDTKHVIKFLRGIFITMHALLRVDEFGFCFGVVCLAYFWASLCLGSDCRSLVTWEKKENHNCESVI